MLAFPDGNAGLDAINARLAGGERFATMIRPDQNFDTGFTDADPTHRMPEGDGGQGKGLLQFPGDLLQHPGRKGGVGFVFEGDECAVFRVMVGPGSPDEPCFGAARLGGCGGLAWQEVKWPRFQGGEDA